MGENTNEKTGVFLHVNRRNDQHYRGVISQRMHGAAHRQKRMEQRSGRSVPLWAVRTSHPLQNRYQRRPLPALPGTNAETNQRRTDDGVSEK